MDPDTLRELAPHYIAMFLLAVGGLAVVRAIVGDLGFWLELVFVFVVIFAYRPVVVRLGIAPSPWE